MAGFVIGDIGEMTHDDSSSYRTFLTLAEGLIIGRSYSHDFPVVHIGKKRTLVSNVVNREKTDRIQATEYFPSRP
mgnify:CR=1 FL=1